MSAPLWSAIAAQITAATGEPFACDLHRSVGGGCINSTAVIEGNGRRYFVKLNDAQRLSMFEAEAAGLNEIAASHSVRVPLPVCSGTGADHAYLVLEYIEFGHGDSQGLELLGLQLAAMHRTQQKEFGWRRDNTIGSTPQINTPDPNWVSFWQRHRLEYQLRLAAANGYRGELLRAAERLLADIGLFFTSYSPVPSLLHGDLWAGNYAIDSTGQPVIYDPAVYYGDREADIAMTELFGVFAPGFYQAYREAWPLDPGYSVRKHLYNLYHVLNHLNLFGGGYRAQAEGLIGRLLSEVR
jgi:protein-ribulosamine 3-kinase